MNKVRRLLDDCFLHDKDRLKHAEALKLIAERVSVVAEGRSTKLAEAHGRVAAEDVVAPRDVPDFANAAVDGYAFAHASLGPGETKLKVGPRIAAGDPAGAVLGPREAARIFTGAPMPGGSDSCVMQEDVRLEGEWIAVPPGAEIRRQLPPRGRGSEEGRDRGPARRQAEAAGNRRHRLDGQGRDQLFRTAARRAVVDRQ